MIVITGATGHLGRLVIYKLLAAHLPATEIAAAVRHPEKAADLAALGVEIRYADYDRPQSLPAALVGADAVLLISSSETMRNRAEQHRAVVDATVEAKVGLLVYTSILGGERATQRLAEDHKTTENLIRESGVNHVILRNGWYTENYTEQLGPALALSMIVGSASPGALVATATREEYAEAAAVVLTKSQYREPVYELNGDTAWSMAGLAAEVTRQAGVPVHYQQVSPTRHREILIGAGLPELVADLVVDADAAIDRGELASSSGALRGLIGRPTAPLADAVDAALRGR